ncbi:MAG: hypothetical protein ACI92Z_000343, partial [Paracoccaceae bacterium]
DPAALTSFDLGGYVYNAAMSEVDRPVFLRPYGPLTDGS